MKTEWLKEHNAIGWDFDGTLWDHDLATLMHQYIKEHPEQKHFIVTFRSGKRDGRLWAEEGCWIDLDRCGSGLKPEHFVGIINMSEAEFDENCSARSGSGLYIGPTDFYKEWKGKVCSEAGITILIDDNFDHTFPGCEKHGVDYVNPDDLTGLTTDRFGYIRTGS